MGGGAGGAGGGRGGPGGAGGSNFGSERTVELFSGKLLVTEMTTHFSIICEHQLPLAPFSIHDGDGNGKGNGNGNGNKNVKKTIDLLC